MQRPTKYLQSIFFLFLAFLLLGFLEDVLGQPQSIRPFSQPLSANVRENLERLVIEWNGPLPGTQESAGWVTGIKVFPKPLK